MDDDKYEKCLKQSYNIYSRLKLNGSDAAYFDGTQSDAEYDDDDDTSDNDDNDKEWINDSTITHSTCGYDDVRQRHIR